MEINHNAIAAAIDASGVLADLSIGPAATTTVEITSALQDCNHEAKNPGPTWTQEIAARPDGSPCLNALADLHARAEACARAGEHELVAWAKVYWGSHCIAFEQSLYLTIFRPSPRRVEMVKRQMADLQAAN